MRSLKPYKVDHIASPDGEVGADVMFDRNEKKFFVEVIPGDAISRVYADLLEDVKREGRVALGKATRFDWKAFILIGIEGPRNIYGRRGSSDYEVAGVRLEFRRFERAAHPLDPDKVLEREHVLDVDPEYLDRRDEYRPSRYNGPEKVGSTIDSDGGEVLLEYDQSVWDGLCRIKAALDEAGGRLAELLRRKDAAKRLAEPTSIMALPEPKKRKVKR